MSSAQAGAGAVDDSHCNVSALDMFAKSLVQFNDNIALGLDKAASGIGDEFCPHSSAMEIACLAAESFVRFNEKIALGLEEAGPGIGDNSDCDTSEMDIVR